MILDALMRGLSALTADTPGERQWKWWKSQGFASRLPTASGVEVNEQTAMGLSSVYRAISILAETSSTLPLQLFEGDPGGDRDRAADHPAQKLLDQPNPLQNSQTFRECMTAQLVGRGNAYAEIVWGIGEDGNRRPVALWPIPAGRVQPRLDASAQKLYEVRRPDGKTIILEADECLHLRGKGDLLEGWSPLQLAREAIGVGLAAERHTGAQIGGGNRPAGILHFRNRPAQPAIDGFISGWNKDHGGSDKVGRVGFIWGSDVNWVSTSISNEDAQLLETRQFTVSEIARFFGVPPHLLYDLSRATFSNIEQMGLDFLAFTLLYWLKKWALELRGAVLLPEERSTFFFEHQTAALIMADIQTRYDAYQKARMSGWMDGNEIRKLENKPARPDAGVLIVASGSMRADSIPREPAPTPTKLQQQGDGSMAVRRAWLTQTVDRMIAKESKALARLAKDPGKFLPKVEEFYQHHAATCADAFTPIAGDGASIAAAHCRESLDLVLEVTDEAKPSTLETDLSVALATWPARAEAFARRVFQE